MNNKTDNSTLAKKPDLNRSEYRQLLQSILKETDNLNLLSLMNISTGSIYFQPDDSAIEQASLASLLFSGKVPGTLPQFEGAGNPELVSFDVGGCQLVAIPIADGHITIIALRDQKTVNKLKQLIIDVNISLGNGPLAIDLKRSRQVMRAWKLDKDRLLQDKYCRPGSENSQELEDLDSLDPVSDLLDLFRAMEDRQSSDERTWLDGVTVVFERKIWRWMRIPFISDHVLLSDSLRTANDENIVAATKEAQHDVLRMVISDILASGLETKTEPFPKTDIEFNEIVKNIRDLETDDLIGRLVQGGFADHPIDQEGIKLRCMECIYYLPNRRWCDLPELPLPVDLNWYCRLWKM